MTAVTRLVTHAELDEADTTARQLSVSARLEAVLADGRSVVLLDDRGWGSSGENVRASTTVEDIEDTARMVVGPDEPFGDETREQAEGGHWAALADILKRQGVDADGPELARLPHDVTLGNRLHAWLAGS
ncbi:hypothetical protein E1265_07360 [Streptomyces sp. 8K308]|uniref:hypothetical protein n=1 Tax=Streptomyces sp. 8K308 TaxID=2530388 RepID=UPI00104BC416|nr:hypothetical protein [Streptomyces sp. 8K308]TDC25279.1 hypothetical protein E1265_07360 [Streptomyces sp. 8K308]